MLIVHTDSLQRNERCLEAVRRGFGAVHVLVVGDLMLDRYLWGEVNRISPEAPVPVVRLKEQTEQLGGAANVAANLAGLGLQVTIAGFVGADSEGLRLMGLLSGLSSTTDTVVRLSDRPTTTKTRVISGHQQMLRLDLEHEGPVPPDELAGLIDALRQKIRTKPAAVILSDYAKGVVCEHVSRLVIQEARSLNIPVFVDPKGRDYSKYIGATAITPNRSELALACRIPPEHLDDLLKAGEELRQRLELRFLAITRGEEGVTLIEPGAVSHVAAVAKKVFDVSGAGDTVIATLTAGVVAGLNCLEAIHLANVAAGIVVGKVGTAPIDKTDLLEALSAEETLRQANKICSVDEAIRRVEKWRSNAEKIVFTNGCFDLLHAGHISFLEGARREGERLVVGLNTDRSVRALKGALRPIIPEQERARVLGALECVDAIVLFDEDTPLNLIKLLRPGVLVKGTDYSEDQVAGAAEVKSWGGRLLLLPIIPGWSSTEIIKKIEASKPGR
jgi:D-beta-D-heptose 7-phosphate kinase/D-beta-D-heptose 1-phosphate adenosyltransferase